MKTTRKKMLLSSIAMLLVALVALGSATYAWFTISKSVYADGMALTAQTEAGLEISNTVGYADASFDATKVSFTQTYDSLKLVSCDTATPTLAGFFAGNVDEAGTWQAKTSAKINDFKGVPSGQDYSDISSPASGENTAATNYFAVYKVKVRSKKAANASAAVTRNNLKGKIELGGTGNTYVRAAIIDGNTVKATYGSETTPKAVKSVSNGTPTMETQTLTASGTETTLASTIDGTGKEYIILCWFEGEDTQAINDNANKQATVKVTFSYES